MSEERPKAKVIEVSDLEPKKIKEKEEKIFKEALKKEIKKESLQIAKGAKKTEYDRAFTMFLQGFELKKISELLVVDMKELKKWHFDKDWDQAKLDVQFEKEQRIKQMIVDGEVAKQAKVLDQIAPIVSKLYHALYDKFTPEELAKMSLKDMLSALNNLGTLQAKITGELVENTNVGFTGPDGIWKEWANAPKTEEKLNEQDKFKYQIQPEKLIE